jgi:hypothetical protein
MANLDFSMDWLSAGSTDPVFRDTSAQLAICLDKVCLTRNEDLWSKTVRDSILVSVYPLASWLAGSWWRLNHEPLPATRPPLAWRMAHELGAANHGFVWPRILFVPDGETMSIWAEPIATPGQSVNYTTGLETVKPLSMNEFQRATDGLVESVLSRLEAVGQGQTELASLWALVKEDRNNAETFQIRQLEAQMGFDPAECLPAIIAEALRMQATTGRTAMSELAPVFGDAISRIGDLQRQSGLQGHPQVTSADIDMYTAWARPWEQGAAAAKRLRERLDNRTAPISDTALLDLLGVSQKEAALWSPAKNPVAIAKPGYAGHWDLIPRKPHPIAKRFEWARFLGDFLSQPVGSDGWLVSSDLATARQKRQRAFAAEFLCPIDVLVDVLNGDYSESAQEEAAEHFKVSEKTVGSLLANHGYIERVEPQLPYRLAV